MTALDDARSRAQRPEMAAISLAEAQRLAETTDEVLRHARRDHDLHPSQCRLNGGVEEAVAARR